MAVEVAVAAAINVARATIEVRDLCPVGQELLDPFQTTSGISLELLETAVFLFASRPALQYR